MQLIRAEANILRKTFGQMFRKSEKRSFRNAFSFTLFSHYNRTSSSHARSRCKPLPTILTRSISNNPTLYQEDDEYDMDSTLGHYNVRHSLHLHSVDPLTKKINECVSVEELFTLIDGKCDVMNAEHISHVVLVLWDLQKIYNDSYLQNLLNDDVEHSPEFMLSNYLNKLQDHKDFKKVLETLEKNIDNLTVCETSCCLLYLKKMGVAMDERCMERLIERCDRIIDEAVSRLRPVPDLVDITRITAAIEPKQSFMHLPVGQKVLPDVLDYLDNCKTPQELRLLTFLLRNIQLLVTEPVLTRYKTRLKYLIDSGILNKQHYPILLRAADFLSFPGWYRHNVAQVTEICEMLAPEIPTMDAGNISTLHKVFQSNLEPGHILPALNKRVGELLTAMLQDDSLGTCLRLPHTLFCYATYSPPEKRPAFEKILLDNIAKIFPTTIAPFYKTLRHLKTQNEQLCDKFWGKTIYFLIRDSKEDSLLLLFCQKYLYFSNVGQIYRNMYFERFMIDLLIKKFDEGFLSAFPKKLARMGAFILAYGLSNDYASIKDVVRVVEQIEAVKEQFDALDCLLLSRGLQMASISLVKKQKSAATSHLLHRVDLAITEQANALSLKINYLNDLNCLIKCHIMKKTTPNSDLILELIKKYITLPSRCSQMNSMVIRDISYSLTVCKVIVPTVCEEIAEYVVNAKNRILGDTAFKILDLYYSLGYEVKTRGVFNILCEVIDRDKHAMSSLSLLQACCALAFYHQLPEYLIKYVFSIAFMERLDAEVAACYQQWAYPRRVRWQLMHLNRCVCIEYPQHRVPWFHHKYMQEQIASTQIHNNHLGRSVLETLTGIWPQANVKSPHFSPYGYRIDMHLTLDDNNGVGTADSGELKHKIAVMLLDNSKFCKVLNEDNQSEGSYYKTVLNGPTVHQNRHLEMLGYKLVTISSSLWYSMHMTEPNVKADILKQKILDYKNRE